MKQEQLNAIKERTEKATQGPWIVAPEECGSEGQGVYESEGFGCICEVGDPYPRGNNRPQENMDFIANAREDVPTLVAEVERLRKALEKVMEVEAPIMEGWETPAYKIAREALDGDSDVKRKQDHHT